MANLKNILEEEAKRATECFIEMLEGTSIPLSRHPKEKQEQLRAEYYAMIKDVMMEVLNGQENDECREKYQNRQSYH